MGSLMWLFQFLLYFSQYQLAFSSSSLLSFSSSAHPLCRHDQRSALLQFKHLFDINKRASSICDHEYGIPSYPKTMSWDENATDCCNWDGVTCDGLTGHVIGLDLSCSQLYGTIHPNSSLFQLSHLQWLNLANNHFNKSRISFAFGSFASLTHLNLSFSAFSGSIPSEISHLSKLISLDLSSSRLRLEPLHFTNLLKNLTRLQELILVSVNIFSSLPKSLTNLSSLSALDLSSSGLQGNLPDTIFHIPNLQRLVLCWNFDLDINLPKSTWGSGSSLNELDLSSTNLIGELPDSIGYLKSLESLRIKSTSLSGKLPDSIGFLKSLNYLILSCCELRGSIPKSLWNLTQIRELDLSSNYFEGRISSNQLMGPIPFNLSGLQNLQKLSLYQNSLTGVIPPSFFTLPSLQALDLSSNHLTGQIPEFQHDLLPPIKYFLISSNNLSGEIPSSICNASFLEILDLSHNKLSGAVPQCLGNFNSVLSGLNLRSNEFTGTLPMAFANPNQLRNLDLSGNQFKGPLPRSLANCTSLEVLNVGNNKINDTFPYWLETLPELQVLVVRSNRFHGPVNTLTSKFSFPRLRIVDLSYNGFTGYLPGRYFEHFQAMKNSTMPNEQSMTDETGYYHDSLTVTMKGNEIELVRILTIITTIDLSSNNFSGEIPSAVGKLNSLTLLNFSHNSLTGHIPESLGDLASLESLDISSNHLTGRIPSQLTSLTYLAVLNLSWNRLIGPIPRGKQFDTFENSSYAGNSGLCGVPLSKECQDNRTEVQPPVSQQEEDDPNFEGFTWKIVVIGYGCGMTLGLLLGYLMFLFGRPRFFVKLFERKLSKKVVRLRRTVWDQKRLRSTVGDTVARRN